ncbi:nucleotidyltransferase family protein [Mahella sp.]|uniref:nucleotidyltransferase family protein n=1 Tax=Mahella sp. TaxID=2798721 RepID=UPI0025BFDDE8|nr:nucleotidyltransferase family protein [Mahella sp.]MBZ4666106.1 hypothetical protein [Mahella sp.]
MDIERLKKACISTNATIREAIEVIDKSALEIALVVDDEFKLLGMATDGDIRRAILRGADINACIETAMNKNYTVIMEGTPYDTALRLMSERSFKHIPVTDAQGHLKDMILWQDIIKPRKKTNFVLLLAGGLGTRLRPLTEDVPKPMLKVGDKPIIETIIEQFKQNGFTNILISVNYKADVVEGYLKDGRHLGVDIHYIKETKRLGTAGPIRLAKEYLVEPFFVMNGDLLTNLNLANMMDFHMKNGFDLTIATKKYEMQIPYGVVRMDDIAVTGMDEKPIIGYFINAGIYCLNPKLIDYIPENEYYDFNVLINQAIDNNLSIGSFPITEYWMDIGQMADYQKAANDYYNIFG